MGLVRPLWIKKICEEIYRYYPDRVTNDFESNKKLVMDVTTVGNYKYPRNRIAGYLVKIKEKEGRIILAPKKLRKPRNKKERQQMKRPMRKWIG